VSSIKTNIIIVFIAVIVILYTTLLYYIVSMFILNACSHVGNIKKVIFFVVQFNEHFYVWGHRVHFAHIIPRGKMENMEQ